MSEFLTPLFPVILSYVIANKLTNIHIGAQSANNKYIYDIAGNLITNIKNGIINTAATINENE